MTANSGNNFSSISNNIASPAPTGSWITPYEISPADPNTLLAGYDKIYLSGDQGELMGCYFPCFCCKIYYRQNCVVAHEPQLYLHACKKHHSLFNKFRKYVEFTSNNFSWNDIRYNSRSEK